MRPLYNVSGSLQPTARVIQCDIVAAGCKCAEYKRAAGGNSCLVRCVFTGICKLVQQGQEEKHTLLLLSREAKIHRQ